MTYLNNILINFKLIQQSKFSDSVKKIKKNSQFLLTNDTLYL